MLQIEMWTVWTIYVSNYFEVKADLYNFVRNSSSKKDYGQNNYICTAHFVCTFPPAVEIGDQFEKTFCQN